MYLKIESPHGVMFLNEQETSGGYGVQVPAGVLGFGMPAVQTQFAEGAGDGARFRGQRLATRDIDLTIDVHERNRRDLVDKVRYLSRILSEPFRLLAVDGEDEWYTDVVRTGGFDYAVGLDTNARSEFTTNVSLRAGDPAWTRVIPNKVIFGYEEPRGLLTTSLAHLNIRSDGIGGNSVIYYNDGDLPAWPVWNLHNAATSFRATCSCGMTFRWEGVMYDGDFLAIDTRKSLVIDGSGANKYAEIDPAPQWWKLPTGSTGVSIEVLGESSETILEMI